MSQLRVHNFAISLDGYGAGPDQGLEHPLGRGGEALHEWMVATRTFHRMTGKEQGETGDNDDFVARGMENLGAWIMGRNMFGPIRGPWPDDAWRGWWGERPPYRVPVFVLTHHPRPDIVMEGGTTFHFVTDGIDDALRRAREAAGGKDVRLGGGPTTIQQYLRARLVDTIHLAVVPIALGAGAHLFAGTSLLALGYRNVDYRFMPRVQHYVFVRDEARP